MIAAGAARWAQAFEVALDLVVPQECAGCGAPGLVWCPGCSTACAGPSLQVSGPVPGRAACAHAGPAGRAVVAFKDAGVRRLGRPLGVLLSRAIRDSLAETGGSVGRPIWVVPIPSRRSAVRSRGSDHTAVLAGRAARLLRDAGLPAHRCRALEHTRASRDQVGLSRADRIANVSGSLRALELPPGEIVIVDDVTTTGATVAEAVRAMAAAGRGVSCAATVTLSGGHPWGASGTRAD